MNKMKHKGPLGHLPVNESLILKKELKFLHIYEFDSLLSLLPGCKNSLHIGDVDRCFEAYHLYALSAERYLRELKIVLKYRSGAGFKLESRTPFTDGERKIAKEYHKIKKYIKLDFTDTIIRARILLDKIAVLSRYFVDSPDQWPVRSFADQCKKFKADNHSFNKDDQYVKHVSTETEWFEIPLKLIRDDYIVHRSQPHIAFDGLHWGENNKFTDLNFIVLNHEEKGKGMQSHVIISIRRLIRDIYKFLNWFAVYGKDRLNQKNL
jgi:hypothetical protein